MVHHFTLARLCLPCLAQVTAEGGWQIPPPKPATFNDWLKEFGDASKGAQPPLPLTGVPWTSKGI